MKYIRTKAGEIYDIDDLYVCENLNGKPYGVKDSSWVIYQESIIKQADTIEELCDEFVAMKPNNLWRILSAKDYLNGFKDEMNESYEEGYQVYGAIWTDKGLIYVARMNKKGELKLL